jgi:hypothetical protein
MASPVIITELTLSEPPHLVGLELRHQHDLGADEALPHDGPLCRPVHERRDRQVHHAAAGTLLDQRLRVGHPRVRHGVGPAAERVEDVLVAPHDALGHPGRAARVEDVEIVARTRLEVALRRLARQCGLELSRTRWRLGVGPVLDHHELPQIRQLGRQRGDQGRELSREHQCLQVGVGQQVAQLVLDVAVVDVDPDRPQLEDGPRGLDPFD